MINKSVPETKERRSLESFNNRESTNNETVTAPHPIMMKIFLVVDGKLKPVFPLLNNTFRYNLTLIRINININRKVKMNPTVIEKRSKYASRVSV